MAAVLVFGSYRSSPSQTRTSLRLMGDIGVQLGRVVERSEANRALAAERNLLRTILDHIPDQVFIKDRDSRFVLCNAATYEALPEHMRADLAGRSDFDITEPERARAHRQEELEIMATGEGYAHREYDKPMAPGGEGYYLSTKLPLRDEAGNVIGLLGINHDITEFRKLARRVEQSGFGTAVWSRLPVGVFVHRDGRLLYANPAGLRMFGAQGLDELLGQDVARYLRRPGRRRRRPHAQLPAGNRRRADRGAVSAWTGHPSRRHVRHPHHLGERGSEAVHRARHDRSAGR